MNNKAELRYLDLSGYMFSGKSAVSDLIREFDGFNVPNYHCEFDLIRISGGLAELRYNIVENWSPMRADQSLRKFINTIKILSRTPKGFRRLYQIGYGYSNIYPNINEATYDFINNLINESWDINWPHEILNLSPFQIFKTKMIAKVRGENPWPTINYKLITSEKFDLHAKNYVSRLLSNHQKNNVIVTHNALEPYNPEKGFCFFSNVKSIVIDRDVRDIYMTSITKTPGYNDEVTTFSRIAGSFDVDIFIARQKELRRIRVNCESKDILRMNFEDFIFNYESSITKLMNFLELEKTSHKYKNKYFDPESSKKNTRLWEGANKQVMINIKKIERELSDYCYL